MIKTTNNPYQAKRFATRKEANEVSCTVMNQEGGKDLVFIGKHPTKTGYCVTNGYDASRLYLVS